MSVDLFMPIKFRSSIQLSPSELSINFEDIILKKLKNNLENMCSRHGYIKNNSIKIIKRSIGQFKKQHFNGNILFELQCIAEICNPAKGSIIKCRVKAKNDLGLLAEAFYENIPILEIVVPKISAGIQSEVNIEKINVGEEINIEVCGKRHQLFIKTISIIGKVIKSNEEKIKLDIIQDEDDDREDKESVNLIDDELLIIEDDDDNLSKISKIDGVEEDTVDENEDDEIDDDDNSIEDEDADEDLDNGALDEFEDLEIEGGEEELFDIE
jgi:DNA-directed RNA polymerase subunit E'/Rpb7